VSGATTILLLSPAVFADRSVAFAQDPQTPVAQAGQPQTALDAKPGARPVFEDGQAQVVAAFSDPSTWIREELWVEAPFDLDDDGRPDRLHVGVIRPMQTETEGLRVPVIYESSPYFSGTSGAREYLWDVRQELDEPSPPRESQPPVQAQLRERGWSSQANEWVPRGFAVVHSEAPGTGQSQGCPTVGGPPESLAPKAVIDWLNGRAKGFTTPYGNEEVVAGWSTGKVGMTGTSYNGTIPVAAASTGVEGLEAIIPIAPNTSYYRYYRNNGLVVHPGGWLGEDIDFLYDFINSGNPEFRDHCNAKVRDGEMAAGRDRATGDYNEFWAEHDLQNDIDGIKAAVLMSHAFNDWNVKPEHSVLVYEAIKKNGVPHQSYFHQGGHGGAPPFELMNRWFTRYLYGVENGVENDPKAWIVREGDERSDPTPYPDYPHPDAAPVTLYVRPGGVQTGSLELTPATGQGAETLVDNFSFGGQALAQAEWTEHRLLYVSPELSSPVHVSGWPRVTLSVASSKPAVNLSVYLVSLPWVEGGRRPRGGLVTRGWADPRNHASLNGEEKQNQTSLDESEPLVPGQFYDLTFYLQPDDQIIAAGQRLGLMIFSTDRDFTLWPEPGTELTVDLDSVAIEIPVVGGEATLRSAWGQ
jgi:X-Pro dipeptidyl-peptidase